MGKRILLFLGTNLLVLLLINIILSLLGVDSEAGTSLSGLMLICLLWGSIGSFISLMISKWSAKRAMNLELLDPSGPYGFVVKRVHEYANSAKISPPEVYRYDSDELNAFATGPSKNNSLVAVSQGLLNDFDRAELEGVLGHEVAHIANGDMVTMALVQGVVNAFVMFLARIVAIAIDNFLSGDDEGEGLGYFAYFVVVSILQLFFGLLTAPLVAWFSRAREYKADAGGAKLAGREKMLSALKALEGQFSVDRLDTSTPSFKSMKISGKGVIALLSTHPPLSDRIRALESRSTH